MFNCDKFFEDNAHRIASQSDPVMWNINAGLLALSKELAMELHNLRQELRQARQEIANLQQSSRSFR